MIVNNELYLQWEKLIKKIAKKYVNNPYRIEFDDLIQIGSIGFIEGARSFDDSLGIPLINYLSICIKRSILKEFKSLSYDKRKTNWIATSLNKSINESTDSTIEESIEDVFTNVSEEIENKLMNDFFQNMFYKYLSSENAYIITSKIIYNKTSNEIANDLNCSSEVINRKYRSSLETLCSKSKYLRVKREEFYKSKEISSLHFDSKVEREAFKFVLWRG